FDHGGDVVHSARFVRIYANIRGRKDFEQILLRNPSGERDNVSDSFLMGHLNESRQPGTAADTCEVDVISSYLFHVHSDIKQYVNSFLVSDIANVTDEMSLALLPGRIRRNSLKRLEIGPVADYKNILRA